MTAALVDPDLLESVRRQGVLLRNGSGNATEFCYIHKFWRFFFKPSGNQAPENGTDSNGDGLPDYIERMLCRLEVGYEVLSELFGLPKPLKDDLKYVDVQLDDIPLLHGVALGRARETEHAILAGTPYRGRALGVKLHRGLIDQTATPQHEVFHLFQYWQVPFINGWFMEGLATWYHRLYKNYAAREQTLPATFGDLAELVMRKHDAEAFWNRLFRLCDAAGSEVPEPFRSRVDVRQKHFPGRRFLRHLLAFLAARYPETTRDLQDGKVDFRNLPSNNILIFRGILSAIDALAPEKTEELSAFVAVLRKATDLGVLYGAPEVQDLLHWLRDGEADIPLRTTDGVLHSPYFDPITGMLSVESLEVRGLPPVGLSCVRRLQGNLSVSDIREPELCGFEALETVSGTLSIAGNPGLEALSGLPALQELGALLIQRNPLLSRISGLPALRLVRKDLRITQCRALCEITGLSTLSSVAGEVELAELPALHSIAFLGQLTQAANLVIRSCPIDSGEPLRRLCDNNPEFKGGIRITGSRLEDVDFLASLRSIGSSLYLSENRLKRIDGLANLETVDASFTLAGNQLTNLAPLRKLRSVAGILSVSNNALTSLQGLENLRAVRTKKWGDTPSTLRIYGNPDLRDISALANVEADDHYLILHIDESQDLARCPPEDSPFRRNTLHLQDFRSRAVIPAWRFGSKTSVDRRGLRRAMRNHTLDCVVDLEGDADTLVIVFSGRANQTCWSVVDALDAHRVILADPRGTWYHGGIPGIAKDLDGTVGFLRRIAASRPYRRVLCMGAGPGGTMAILAGWLIGADQVIAFSPRTLLDRDQDKLPASAKPAHLDLNRVLATQPNDRTTLILRYSAGSVEERAQVTRLACPTAMDCAPYEVLDRVVAGGHSAAAALDAEAFLAVTRAFGGRFELVDGRATAVSASRSGLGEGLADRLTTSLPDGLTIHPAPEMLWVPAANAWLSPDLFVTAGSEAVLAVDVVDDALMAFDRGRRGDLFTQIASLREYLLIDTASRRARLLRRTAGGGWTEQDPRLEGGIRLESIDTTLRAFTPQRPAGWQSPPTTA